MTVGRLARTSRPKLFGFLTKPASTSPLVSAVLPSIR